MKFIASLVVINIILIIIPQTIDLIKQVKDKNYRHIFYQSSYGEFLLNTQVGLNILSFAYLIYTLVIVYNHGS